MKFDSRKIQPLMKDAARFPFFKRKWGGFKARDIVDLETFKEKVPTIKLEELLAERMRNGSPFSSRWSKNRKPLVVFQLDYDAEKALYLPLDRRTLREYAEALRRCWSLLGLKKGDAVAIFDYGTSPLSYLASAAFTPYLKRGAADALECLAVCNDGIGSMSQRAVEILKFVRPRILFVRHDCLQPLAAEVESQHLDLKSFIRALVVTENEGVLAKADQKAYEQRLGLPVYRLLRVDIAMFLAVECPHCRLFHSWDDLYLLESLDETAGASSSDSSDGYLVITNWFARLCPIVRYFSLVNGSEKASGCPRGPRDLRIAV